MTWPPSVARIRVVKHGRKEVGLWLPLFVIWPLAVVLWVALLPVIVVAALALWRCGKGRVVLLGGPLAFWLLCRSRGLSIKIERPDEIVQIYFS